MNDEQIADAIKADLEYVRARLPSMSGHSTMPDLMQALVEITKNSTVLAGRGHVPSPLQEIPDCDYASVLISVISLNVFVFVRRPHSVESSEQLLQIHESVKHVRIGVDLAAA